MPERLGQPHEKYKSVGGVLGDKCHSASDKGGQYVVKKMITNKRNNILCTNGTVACDHLLRRRATVCRSLIISFSMPRRAQQLEHGGCSDKTAGVGVRLRELTARGALRRRRLRSGGGHGCCRCCRLLPLLFRRRWRRRLQAISTAAAARPGHSPPRR